jgi:hypothetical protein
LSMSSSVERSLERAYAMGVRNREILGLLAQHCRNAVVEYAGGHGMAEAATGLPIDMRTIRCPFARNRVGAAMNKEWIAVDFYRANCVGCPHRDPVGVPNLATFVAGLDEQTAHRMKRSNSSGGWRRLNADGASVPSGGPRPPLARPSPPRRSWRISMRSMIQRTSSLEPSTIRVTALAAESWRRHVALPSTSPRPWSTSSANWPLSQGTLGYSRRCAMWPGLGTQTLERPCSLPSTYWRSTGLVLLRQFVLGVHRWQVSLCWACFANPAFERKRPPA